MPCKLKAHYDTGYFCWYGTRRSEAVWRCLGHNPMALQSLTSVGKYVCEGASRKILFGITYGAQKDPCFLVYPKVNIERAEDLYIETQVRCYQRGKSWIGKLTLAD